MDLSNTPRDFRELNIKDKDLTMFTLTQLRLEKQDQVVQMVYVMEMAKTACQILHMNYNIQYPKQKTGGSDGDRDEEEDPDGDVDHLLAHHPPPWHHLRHHLLQADVLRGGKFS